MDDDSMMTLAVLWFAFILFVVLTPENNEPPPINPLEQKALYNLLNSIDPTTPLTTLYPHDFCISPPSFLHCDSKSHIVQLNFGFISDQNHLLPCSTSALSRPSSAVEPPHNPSSLHFRPSHSVETTIATSFSATSSTQLPAAVTTRVSIEAGTTFGWEKIVGSKGKAISIDRFGASAPAGKYTRSLVSLRRLLLLQQKRFFRTNSFFSFKNFLFHFLSYGFGFGLIYLQREGKRK